MFSKFEVSLIKQKSLQLHCSLFKLDILFQTAYKVLWKVKR